MRTGAIELAILVLEAIEASRVEELGRRVYKDPDQVRSFKHPGRRLAHFAGRALVNDLFERVAAFSGYVVPDPEFGYLKAYDRKNHKEVGQCFVNISHTKRMAVACLGAFPVGIDVEWKGRSASRVMAKVATEQEKKAAKDLFVEVDGEYVSSEIALWCAKEAYSKATGLGLNFGLNQFTFEIGTSSFWPGRTLLKGPLTIDRAAVKFLIYQDHLIALCADSQTLASGVRSHVLTL